MISKGVGQKLLDRWHEDRLCLAIENLFKIQRVGGEITSYEIARRCLEVLKFHDIPVEGCKTWSNLWHGDISKADPEFYKSYAELYESLGSEL